MQVGHHSRQPPPRGWHLPQGREMTSPRGGAGSQAPPAGPSREGWGVLGRSSLSPSSHLGDKGEILRRRWDGKALGRTLTQALHTVAHIYRIQQNPRQTQRWVQEARRSPGAVIQPGGQRGAGGGVVSASSRAPCPLLPLLPGSQENKAFALSLHLEGVWFHSPARCGGCVSGQSVAGLGIEWGQQKRTGDTAEF